VDVGYNARDPLPFLDRLQVKHRGLTKVLGQGGGYHFKIFFFSSKGVSPLFLVSAQQRAIFPLKRALSKQKGEVFKQECQENM